MASLFNLVPGTAAPFTGGLGSQPNDFTLGLNLTGGGLTFPYRIAIDAAGNAWVDNETAIFNTGSLSEFSSAGQPLSSAIDTTGNVWAANDNNASLTELIGAAAPVVTPIAANLTTPYGTKTVNLP